MIIKVIMMHEKKWLYNYKLRKGIQRSLDQLSLTIRASVFRKETSVRKDVCFAAYMDKPRVTHQSSGVGLS